MNVATITAPRDVARAKLREYRRGLHHRADQEYQQIAAAYEALEQGLRVINVATALRDAPRDAKGRPQLAIARADRREVMFEWSRWTRDSRPRFTTKLDPGGVDSATLTMHFEFGERSPDETRRGFAFVPIVPPDVRGRHDMRRHFVLWEVEQWADRRLTAGPDIDPFLLRHIAGDLYAIVGEWALTDVERAVLAGRAFLGVR